MAEMDSREKSSEISVRLDKTSSELRDLEQVLVSGDIDTRILREFRQAVNHIRQTAWAVQQWIEAKEKHGDTFKVMTLIAMERVRVATLLNQEIVLDLDASELTIEDEGISDLLQSAQALVSRLK